MSDPVAAVREALRGSEAWVVGGTVRDELLGRPVRDVDLALAGDPEAAARAVAKAVRGPVFPLTEAFGAWRAIDRAGAASCATSRRSRATRSRRTSASATSPSTPWRGRWPAAS